MPPRPGDEELSILVATWNVGNQRPDPHELEHWLPMYGGNHDLIVIGTQENAFKRERGSVMPSASDRGSIKDDEDEDEESSAIESSIAPAAALGGSRRAGRQHAWDAMCAERLGSGWTLAAHVVLREMRLSVYCTRARFFAADVSDVATAYAATGLAGVVGNKGGLVARLTVGGVSLAFCSCHLEAHEGAGHCAGRNAMCRRILLKTADGGIGSVASRGGARGPARACLESLGSGRRRRLDAAHAVDHIIWLGDLNYRVSLDLIGLRPPPLSSQDSPHSAHVEAVVAMAEAGELSTLVSADELRCARRVRQASSTPLVLLVDALLSSASQPARPVSQPAPQPVSQSASQPAPQPASRPASRPGVPLTHGALPCSSPPRCARLQDGHAFVGFEEGQLASLRPTFKVERGHPTPDPPLTPL